MIGKELTDVKMQEGANVIESLKFHAFQQKDSSRSTTVQSTNLSQEGEYVEENEIVPFYMTIDAPQQQPKQETEKKSKFGGKLKLVLKKPRVKYLVFLIVFAMLIISFVLSSDALMKFSAINEDQRTFKDFSNEQEGTNELKQELKSIRHRQQMLDAHLNNSAGNVSTITLANGYISLENGWIAPFNGYQYKKTPTAAVWNESRQICQSWGADLIVYGVHDTRIRNAIYRGLSLTNFWHWIGLTDQESEGNFRWLNGERASSTDDNFWYLGQPDGDSDCCLARFDFVFPNTYEWPCSQAQYGLCEKPV